MILPIGLQKIANGRDFIKTEKFAEIFSIKKATVRRNFCMDGHVYGIKPVKVGNRLLWSVEDIAKKMNLN